MHRVTYDATIQLLQLHVKFEDFVLYDDELHKYFYTVNIQQ